MQKLTSTLDYEDIANEVLHAYEEGWGDYDSPCAANSLFLDQWNKSIAKRVYDELMHMHKIKPV